MIAIGAALQREGCQIILRSAIGESLREDDTACAELGIELARLQ